MAAGSPKVNAKGYQKQVEVRSAHATRKGRRQGTSLPLGSWGPDRGWAACLLPTAPRIEVSRAVQERHDAHPVRVHVVDETVPEHKYLAETRVVDLGVSGQPLTLWTAAEGSAYVRSSLSSPGNWS